jgi:predicted transcriptional regulator of viral defense system
MNKSRLEMSKSKIEKYFNKASNNIYKYKDIKIIVGKNHQKWSLASHTGIGDVINFLIKNGTMKRVELDFPSRKEILYVWGDASAYKIALKVMDDSYLSHFSAMQVHDLTEQVPKTIYVNSEQSPKLPNKGSLMQDRIDWAFKRKPRVTRKIAAYKDSNICLLNGMHTGHLGVNELVDKQGEKIKVTDIERTLIDIAVRPFYAGGIFEVLRAYRQAQNSIDVDRLIGYLKRLNYTYPYHQAIGLYMEKADYL